MIEKFFEQSGIRLIEHEGKPWVVAKDVAAALGIAWRSDTLNSIKPEWKGDGVTVTPSSESGRGGGVQEVVIINRQAALKLITRSRKLEANALTDWMVETIDHLLTHGFVDLRLPVITTGGLKCATHFSINEIEYEIRRANILPRGWAEDPNTGFFSPAYLMTEACHLFRWDFAVPPQPFRGAWVEGELTAEMALRRTQYKMIRSTRRNREEFGSENDWKTLPDYLAD